VIYSKGTLLTKIREVQAEYVAVAEQKQRKSQADYERALKRWQDKQKAETIETLTATLAKVKKDQPFNPYDLRSNLSSPPSKPQAVEDAACVPVVRELTALMELLETVEDDEITPSALARAGVKDLQKLLRRPC
jgi:hypothetical protein